MRPTPSVKAKLYIWFNFLHNFHISLVFKTINERKVLMFKIFDLEFPSSDSIDYNLGYYNPEFPKHSTSSLTIDTTRMVWVVTDEPRYNTAMITINSSPVYGKESIRSPLTMQTTNSIDVQAYLSLILNTGGLARDKSKP